MRVRYLYDALGHNTDRIVTGAKETLIRRLKFKFDDKGRKIEHAEFNRQDQLEFTRQFTYDGLDNKITVQLFDAMEESKDERLEDLA